MKCQYFSLKNRKRNICIVSATNGEGDILIFYVPPIGSGVWGGGGGGHTDFGADPVGLGIGVTLPCLHNIL